MDSNECQTIKIEPNEHLVRGIKSELDEDNIEYEAPNILIHKTSKRQDDPELFEGNADPLDLQEFTSHFCPKCNSEFIDFQSMQKCKCDKRLKRSKSSMQYDNEESEESNIDSSDFNYSSDEEPPMKKKKPKRTNKSVQKKKPKSSKIGRPSTVPKNQECPTCGKKFSNNSNFKRHVRMHNRENPILEYIYACDQCDKKFQSNYNLERHKRSHTGEKPYSCDFCQQSYINSQDLKKHLFRHTGEQSRVDFNENAIKCKFCVDKLNGYQALLAHYKDSHGEAYASYIVDVCVKNSQFQCELCESSYARKSDLKMHTLKVHPDNRKVLEKVEQLPFVSHRQTKGQEFTCDLCDYGCQRRGDLTRHFQLRHPEISVQYTECRLCYQKFKTPAQLKIHMEGHTEYRACEICGKEFYMKNNYDRHMRTHTGERPFKCDICGKCLSSKINLEKHMFIHTGADKPFSCNYCEFSSVAKHDLFHHHIRKHPIDPFQFTQSENGAIKCFLCKNEEFDDYEALSVHYKIHIKEYPRKKEEYKINWYKDDHNEFCEYCDYSCVRKCEFTRHMKMKHPEIYSHILAEKNRRKQGEKPYRCEICSQAFAYRVNYDRHLFDHSNKEPLSCQYCEASMVMKRDLFRHHMKKHAYEPFQFASKDEIKCFQCAVEFDDYNTLANHYALHLEIDMPNRHGQGGGRKLYECVLCDFHGIKPEFKEHMELLHSEDGKSLNANEVCHYPKGLLYSCEICDNEFATETNLKNHKKQQHGLEKIPEKSSEDEKAYKCTNCPKSFTEQSKLDLHFKVHTGELEHQCQFCDEAFDQIMALIAHLKTCDMAMQAMQNQ